MSKDLHRLVYYSRNKVAGGAPTLAAAVDDILAVSQRNNSACNITGALMFNAGCFGQVLEGERDALEATFERIQRDERHSEVSLLAFEPIAARSFSHWSMGFVGARPGDAARFADIGRSTNFDPAQADGDTLVSALRALALEDEAP
jgi:hypothetical protein